MRRSPATFLPLLALVAPAALQAQRPVELDTLRVQVGARAAGAFPGLTRSTTVLDRDALASAPVRSVAEALAWVLGADLHARSASQADLAIRGGTFEQVLVLVDGVRVSDAQTGHFDLDLAVPLAEVERVEVLRGPATAAYGTDAMGGVVNVVTRRGGGRSTRVEGGSGGEAAIELAGGWSAAGARGRVAVEGRRGDGHRPGTDHAALQARASGGLDVGPRRLEAAVGVAVREFGARAFYTPATAPFDEYEETRTLTATAALRGPAAATFQLQPRLSLRRHDDEFLLRRDDPAFYRNVHRGWQWGAELTGRWRSPGGVALAAGVEGWLDRLRSTALGEREELRGALWAEAAAGRPGRAVGSAGVRLDGHEAFASFVAPSASAAWWLTPSLRLRAAGGAAFRAPSWTDRYYADPASVGSPDLQPETAWEVEAGLAWEGADATVSGAAFVRRTDDAIDWARPAGAPDDEPWRTRNVERTELRGVELEGQLAALGATWRAAAALQDLESRDEAGFASRYALRPLTGTLLLGVRRPLGEHLDVDVRLHHARRAGEAGPAVVEGACVPGRESRGTRVDGRLRATRGRWSAFLDALNAADAQVCEPGAVFAPGRGFRLGVAVGG